MSSLPDSGLSVRELGMLFDQLPVGLVFTDREVRTTRTNAAYRRLVGLPDEALMAAVPQRSPLARMWSWPSASFPKR